MAKGLNPKILHRHVSIRRSGKVVRNVLAQSLISNIKQGKLQKDDEISADEKIWYALTNIISCLITSLPKNYLPLKTFPLTWRNICSSFQKC